MRLIKKTFEVNNLVQVIVHPEDSVVGTVLQVEKVGEDWVQCFLRIPYKGEAYFRFDKEHVVRVGHAALGSNL
jgi:hypothetical protein